MDTKTFVSIDTETSGLSFDDDRVLQIGITVFVKGREVNRTGWYINYPVYNSGYHINKISLEDLEHGRDHNWSFQIIANILKKVPRVICAYNAPFDLMMLASEFRRRNIAYDFSDLRVIDPLVIQRHYNPWTKSPFNKLMYVAKKYGVPYDESELHDAATDSALAGHLWLRQRLYHSIRSTPLELHRLSREWFTEWSDGYAKWLRSKDKEVNITPWPYREDWECFPPSEPSSLF